MSRVQVEGLGYRYPAGEPVLHDVSFTVDDGERLAVLGANGAGKSTLLLHLNGLILPETGGVTVDGTTVTADTLREVRREVGLVFQDPADQLFLPSLLEDVAFGPLNDGMPASRAEAAARSVLESLGLGPAADRAAHHLSGGEQRLASLATALVMRPGLLVLDEPTAGLDARARARVVEILQTRSESLILATHDLDVAAALCGRALVLAGGRVAALGPVGEILGDPELLLRHGLRVPLDPAERPTR